jgi:alpha-glucoside transport system substrate-binding protein
MNRIKWIALLAIFALFVAACGDDDDAAETTEGTTATTEAATTTEAAADPLAGTRVTVFGPESSDEEAGAMQDALDVFAAESGIEIVYTGARDFSEQINAQAAGGNPPDIAVFPQPGKVATFAAEGYLIPVPDDVVAATDATWGPGWMDFYNVDGVQYGLPNKSDLKSIVWYNTAIFEAGGYEIPTTLDALLALTNQMIADGVTPWCVGIESGPATGWTFTDWVEDLMLRINDENLYDEWVAGTVPFDDPRILTVFNWVLDLWNTEGAVFAAGGSIAATPFGDNGQPLADGDCAMHRQASFFAAFIPEGIGIGEGQPINTFYFPAVDDTKSPILVAGTGVSAFRDAPEVWAVMEYLGSAQYSNERQNAQVARKGGGEALSGYLTANLGADPNNWFGLEKFFVETLVTGSPARFDASDLMPAAVGAGTFWTESTSVVNGDKTLEEALAAIAASWPTE